MEKSAEAFRTISEVADELQIPKHVLRFWEGKFVQIKPMKRGGGRRYYRPEDVELLRGIRRLLHDEGYTIKACRKSCANRALSSSSNTARSSISPISRPFLRPSELSLHLSPGPKPRREDANRPQPRRQKPQHLLPVSTVNKQNYSARSCAIWKPAANCSPLLRERCVAALGRTTFRVLYVRNWRNAALAQLVRAPDCGSGGPPFEPGKRYHHSKACFRAFLIGQRPRAGK